MTPARLDAATVRAYSRGVMAVTPNVPDAEPTQAITAKRRRRPATGLSHERRVAWGRYQGKLNGTAYRELLKARGLE